MPRLAARPTALTLLGALSLLGCPADPVTERQLALEAWTELDTNAETPGTYWYEEHNCPLSLTTGTATVVQVTDGVATLVGSRMVCRADCQPGLERYADLVPATLPELIAACPDGATVEYDEQGVLTFCQLREENCLDACDLGHHIAQWEHGVFDGDATLDQECNPRRP